MLCLILLNSVKQPPFSVGDKIYTVYLVFLHASISQHHIFCSLSQNFLAHQSIIESPCLCGRCFKDQYEFIYSISLSTMRLGQHSTVLKLCQSCAVIQIGAEIHPQTTCCHFISKVIDIGSQDKSKPSKRIIFTC